VQNLAGQWIDAPPKPNTFVVNIGKALDSATQGLARATSHRVLSPAKGSTPRYSVPFFQNISPHARLKEVKLEFPEEIVALKAARGKAGESDCQYLALQGSNLLMCAPAVNFSEFEKGEPSAQVNLIGRVK
jgi:isopenicillin N synthase-like dioxygenase